MDDAASSLPFSGLLSSMGILEMDPFTKASVGMPAWDRAGVPCHQIEHKKSHLSLEETKTLKKI